MRLYIDLNCFNRPFDDQRQERVRHETEAVLSILRRIIDGNDSLVWSWALTFENEKHPMPDRRDEIALWEGRAERSISLDDGVKERAKQLTRQGIPAMDSVHLACAEAAGVDVLLTCDDVFFRRARRLSLALRVVNPVAYLPEVIRNG